MVYIHSGIYSNAFQLLCQLGLLRLYRGGDFEIGFLGTFNVLFSAPNALSLYAKGVERETPKPSRGLNGEWYHPPLATRGSETAS